MLRELDRWSWLILIAAIVPAVALGLLISEYSTNVPTWDQWDTPGTALLKAHDGTLWVGDLFAQHNESRKVFPQLAFLALARATGWDVTFEMLAAFLLACGIAGGIFALGRRTLVGSTRLQLVSFALASILVFSPAQFDNWLFGIQLVVFVPIACIVVGLLIALSGMRLGVRLALCIALALVSTFSYANGMLAWLLLLPALIVPPLAAGTRARRQLPTVIVWATGFAATAALYFHDYRRPANHPALAEAWARPLDTARYVLTFLGSPIAFGNLAVAQIVGAALLGLLAVSVLIVAHRRSGALWLRAFAWTMLGTYAVLSAVLAAAGRVGLGVEQAITSRYTTHAVYLIVALVYLTALLLEDARYRRPNRLTRFVTPRLAAALAAVTLILSGVSFLAGASAMANYERDRLEGKACLLLINVAPDVECVTTRLHPVADHLVRRANALNRLGLLDPPLLASARLTRVSPPDPSPQAVPGAFAAMHRTAAGQYLASGRARTLDGGAPADAVVLAYEDTAGHVIAFTTGRVGARAYRTLEALRLRPDANDEWRVTFTAGDVPDGTDRISAWALDTGSGRAYRLAGEHHLSNASAQSGQSEQH